MTDKSNAPTGIMIVDDDPVVAGLSKRGLSIRD